MVRKRELVLIVSFLLAMNAAPALVEGHISEKSEATKSETVEKDGKEIGYEDSPFGFLGPVSGGPKSRWQDYTKYLEELNVHWVRNGGIEGLRWGDVQSYAGASYNWEKYDSMIRALQIRNINLVICILPVNRSESSGGSLRPRRRRMRAPRERTKGGTRRKMNPLKLPSNLPAYGKFVRAVVERYDGDGIDDMRGLRFPIKYWMTSHEPNHPRFWSDSAENYAILVKHTCEAIKEADPEAKIVFAGTAGQVGDYLYNDEKVPEGFKRGLPGRREEEGKDGFFIRFFKKLQEIAPEFEQWIDVMDFHIFLNFGDYSKIETFVYYINRLTGDFGLGKKPIWITETSTFAGRIKVLQRSFQEGMREDQSEREQAQELFKRYVFGTASGVKKIFWGGPLYAGGDMFFTNSGIISQGGEPRLAYYTYKTMVEKLGGSDWNNVEIIETGLENVHVFRFLKEDTDLPVYAAWWDHYKSEDKSDTENNKEWIFKVDANQIKITRAIPKEDSGVRVKDYESAFETETLPVKNSMVTIRFGHDPFFLELIH